MQLDSLDFKILVMLSENARRPYLEIARECGVSGAAVHQRGSGSHHGGQRGRRAPSGELRLSARPVAGVSCCTAALILFNENCAKHRAAGTE